MPQDDDSWGLDNQEYQQALRVQRTYHDYVEAAARVENLSPDVDGQTRRRAARAYFQAVDRYVDSLPDDHGQARWEKLMAEYHRTHHEPAPASTGPPTPQTTNRPCRPLRPGTPDGTGRPARQRRPR